MLQFVDIGYLRRNQRQHAFGQEAILHSVEARSSSSGWSRNL